MAQDCGRIGEFRSRLMAGTARACLAGGEPFATHRRWLAAVAAAIALAATAAHADVPPAFSLPFADADPGRHGPTIGGTTDSGPAGAAPVVALDENYRDTGRRPWFDDGEFGEQGDIGEQGEYSQGEFGERGEAGSNRGSTGRGDETVDESGELLEGIGEGGKPSGDGSPLLPGGGGLIP